MRVWIIKAATVRVSKLAGPNELIIISREQMQVNEPFIITPQQNK